MSSGIEGIGDKFLLKLYEKTVNDGVETIDKLSSCPCLIHCAIYLPQKSSKFDLSLI